MPRSSSTQSQSQPGRRRRGAPAEGEEEEEVNMTSEEEATATQGTKGMSEEVLKKKAAKLIRLAFASELNKKPLKRADVSTTLKQPANHFPVVLSKAQETLKKVFGMELVELKQKYKAGDDLREIERQHDEAVASQTAEATQATQKKGKGRRRQDSEDESEESEEEVVEKKKKKGKAGPSTGLFILRSILAPKLVNQMADPQPIPVEHPVQDEEPDNGALLDWQNGDSTQSGHIALLGIRTIILCLVMSNGRVMTDEQLKLFLRRLSLEEDTVLPYHSRTSPNTTPLTLQKYLDLLDRQHYLQKVRIPNPAALDSPSIEWRWGQRQVEFSEQAAATFIENVMFHGREEDAPAPGRRRAGANDGVLDIAEQKKRMRKNLERAVGGDLTG
ncbi:MAGE family-domain-containing protein [Dioszegia hungarica]|uniref:MAGE family-domain-containing protein n=1 Tax=Dioszegia hungarica TaxID=4972 RepID=A0AA38HDD8_9TREE|nr:MAGE family-domain-containing protein [Dioszegia hungarica]KAI9636924.1 MAGE family-domain-containing protein [Dioszegia hungarica]